MRQKVKIGICETCGKEYDKNLRSSRSPGEKLTCSTECEINYNREHQNVRGKTEPRFFANFWQNKWKIYFLASVVCSLICGLIAVGFYVNYLGAASGNYYVSDADKLIKAWSIPLAFIIGFIIPSIAIVIQKISDAIPW